MKRRILLAEDEINIRSMLKYNLEEEGFETVEAADGAIAKEKLSSEHFDLLLLDLMMPKFSGLEVLDYINTENLHLPIIILSAKDNASDRVEGLRKGADDYVTKPFNLEELLLRIEKLINRKTTSQETYSSVLNFGANSIDFESYEAMTTAGKIALTKTEVAILKLLHQRKNQVVSRKEILNSVYGFEVFPATRTIDNFIMSFRKYFEIDPKNPQYFVSVRGIGYKLVLT